MTNVSPIPVYKLTNVPDALRQVAHQIDSGEIVAVRCVLTLELDDGTVDYKVFGAEPFTVAHAIGLLFCASKRISNDRHWQ